jgi:hypothetical protein
MDSPIKSIFIVLQYFDQNQDQNGSKKSASRQTPSFVQKQCFNRVHSYRAILIMFSKV